MSVLIRNIRYTLVEQAVLSTHVVVAIALIRHLGPEQYGVYSYYLSVAAILSVLTFGAFESLYVREVAQRRDSEALTSTLLLLNFAGALLTATALFLYYLLHVQSERLSLLLMGLTAASTFMCIKNTLRAYFIGRQQLGIAALLNVGLFVVSIVLKVAGILTGQALAYFFLLFVVDTALAIAVFGTAYGWRRAVGFAELRHWSAFLFARGWPLLLAGLAIMVFVRIDQVLLFHLRSEREVGEYASMAWLIEKLYVFVGIVMTGFFPYLAEKYRSDPAQYLRAVRVGHKLFSMIVVPIAAFLIANHEAVVAALFGREFAADSVALACLAAALVFSYWGAINQKVLIVSNALKLDLFFAGCSAVVSVALNALLIPRYGVLGAAAASLAAHSFYFWAQFFIRAYRRYNFYMLAAAPVPLIMSLACLLLSRVADGIVVQALIYCAAYAVLCVLALRTPISEEYGTLGRLFFSRFFRLGRAVP